MTRFYLLFLFLLPLSINAQKQLTAKELQQDAAILWQALNELHPGLYRHNDTAQLEKYYEQLKMDFSKPMDEKKVFLKLSNFTANIKCGHTYVNPFNQRNKIIASILDQKVLLPFTFAIVENKIIVGKSLSSTLETGTVITAINGRKTDMILDELSTYIKTDGNRNKKKSKTYRSQEQANMNILIIIFH